MKDCATALRVGYISKLSTVEYESTAVSVYDTIAPDNAEPPYIIIKSINEIQDRNKHAFQKFVNVTLDVVDRSTSRTGFKKVEGISNDVLAAVIPEDISDYITLDDHQLVTTRLVGNGQLFERNGSEYVYRKILQLEHIIIEN